MISLFVGNYLVNMYLHICIMYYGEAHLLTITEAGYLPRKLLLIWKEQTYSLVRE